MELRSYEVSNSQGMDDWCWTGVAESPQDAARKAAELAWTKWAWEHPNGFDLYVRDRDSDPDSAPLAFAIVVDYFIPEFCSKDKAG